MMFCAKYWGCHQLPERSFFIGNYQMPMCARCFGILCGYIIGGIFVFCRICIHPIIALVFIVPMCIDGGVQLFSKYESNNIRRLFTGILSGVGYVALFCEIMKYICISICVSEIVM